jgi:hypothetical protein
MRANSAHRKSSEPGGNGRYEWSVAGKCLSVILDLQVARILRHQEPSSGPQLGGVLLGRVEATGTYRVYVDDCEPLVWDTARGGAPHLNEKQRQLLEDSVERWQWQPGSPLSAVGFYRTQHGGDLRLTDADLELLDRYFPRDTDVCLLIEPGPQSFTGAFFIREAGEFVSRDSSYLEFTFERPDARLVTSPAPPPFLSISRKQVTTAAMWLAFAGVSLAISHELLSRGPRKASTRASSSAETGASPETHAADLGMRVQRDGDDLVVTWNRLSRGIANAQSGVIAINDAGVDRRLVLTGEQLRSGRLFYRPLGFDVAIRLDLQIENQLVSESVRAVDSLTAVAGHPDSASWASLPPPDPLYPTKTKQENKPRKRPERAAPDQSRSRKAVDLEVSDSPRHPAEPNRTAENKPKPSGPVAGLGGFTRPVGSRVDPALIIPAPEPLRSPLDAAGTMPVEVAQLLRASKPSMIPPQPNPGIRESNPKAAPTGDGSKSNEPKSVRQVPMIIPKDIRIGQSFSITLKVQVNASGKVVSAEPAGPQTPVPGLNRNERWRLTKEAMSAVLRWDFAPATVNGSPVPSSTVVTFHVRPAGK